MKFPTLQLHNKILLALVLGAMFGAMFNIDKHKIKLSYSDDRNTEVTEVVEHWQRFEFANAATGEVRATFGPEDQVKILPYFNKLTRKEKQSLAVQVTYEAANPKTFERVVALEKVQTVAVMVKPVGTVFIRLLMFVAIPLVLSSLIVGAASLGDLKQVGRLGMKTIAIYIITTAVAITIGLTVVNLIQPGTRVGADAREKLMVEYTGNIQDKIEQEVSVDLIDMLVNIVSTNPISAMANGEMLQIVFFALMVGVSLTMIAKDKAGPVVTFFDGFSDLMIRMVELIMTIAPYGVFALVAATVGEFGFDILQTLAWYVGTVLLGLALHLFGTIAAIVRFVGGMSPVRFFQGLKPAMLIAFSSSSSAATLPVNMEMCQQNLGVPKNITSFVLPLGATINMDGTSMYQAIAAVTIAQVYGLDLGLAGQLTILLTAVLASIGTAPVPGVGIVMLIIVLRSVHVPEEGIALILGVDRILDMCRTTVNITGDAAVSVIIARREGVLDQARGTA